MRRLREILRLKFEAGLSQKAIALGAHVAQSTVSDYVSRARRAGLGWPLAPEFDDDAALDRLLFPTPQVGTVAERPEPDWAPSNLAAVLAGAKRLSAMYAVEAGHRSFDILHVAAALHLGATDFLTFDRNQKALAEAEGLTVPL